MSYHRTHRTHAYVPCRSCLPVDQWRYFAEALAWYPPHHGMTGAQVFGVIEQLRAALKDGRVTPADLGLAFVGWRSPTTGNLLRPGPTSEKDWAGDGYKPVYCAVTDAEVHDQTAAVASRALRPE